jgi:hypothetical protein
MIKITLLLAIATLLSGVSTILAQPEKVSPNEIYISPAGFSQDDSLLYDGHFGKLKPTDNSADCKIKVTYSFGTVNGTKLVTKVYDICGEIDTGMSAKKSEIHTGDFIKYGEELTTGDNSSVDIELWDGSEVKLGPNSSVVIEDYMCEGNVLVQLKNGTMWNKVKKLLGGAKYEVKSGTMGGVRGTEFTVEYNNGVEIIKVYEGAFEVYAPKTKNDNKSKAQEMEQLTKDYQAGKISKEEFNRKLTEFMQNANKKIEESTNKMVTAGYMVKVTDVISDIMPIESNDFRWFDDANFNK